MTVDRLTSREGLVRGQAGTSDKFQNIRDAHAGTQEPFNVLTGEKEGDVYDLGSAENRWRDGHFSNQLFIAGKDLIPDTKRIAIASSGIGSALIDHMSAGISSCIIRVRVRNTISNPWETGDDLTITLPWLSWEGGQYKIYTSYRLLHDTDTIGIDNATNYLPIREGNYYLANESKFVDGKEVVGREGNYGVVDALNSLVVGANPTNIILRPRRLGTPAEGASWFIIVSITK